MATPLDDWKVGELDMGPVFKFFGSLGHVNNITLRIEAGAQRLWEFSVELDLLPTGKEILDVQQALMNGMIPIAGTPWSFGVQQSNATRDVDRSEFISGHSDIRAVGPIQWHISGVLVYKPTP